MRPRTSAASDAAVEGEISRYCGNLAPTASEARASYQARQLAELEDRVRRSTEELEQRAVEAREWVNRREAMMKAATDDIVAVYAKMPADAAATQLSAMEDSMAAAVLGKLNPRAASAILGEMEAEKAARLAAIMAGASAADKS
jgi:flagellar motility protein MotE (MotC chaperone)